MIRHGGCFKPRDHCKPQWRRDSHRQMRSRPENVSMIPPSFVHYCSLKCSTGWLNILIIVHFCSESWLNIRIFTQMIVLQISGEYPNCMGQKQTKKTPHLSKEERPRHHVKHQPAWVHVGAMETKHFFLLMGAGVDDFMGVIKRWTNEHLSQSGCRFEAIWQRTACFGAMFAALSWKSVGCSAAETGATYELRW